MSKAIQRYDLEQGSGWDSGGAMLLEAVDGDWIKYEAFAKMEAERDDFERKGKELCTAYGNSLITINDLEKKLKRMQAPVSDEEWEQNADSYIELDAIGRPDVTNDGSWSIRTAVERPVFDSITAARAAEPKEEPKP